ncbi:hypothetical protein PRK78_002936 [Emydomyces testavorans]|uniref:Uncharacterized protein n=1 Tax=Emydomyces testavorans TaxID=2070801 RepID=A0AAF0DG10_9EURO|nr:hypothetical protein PRK78_002936 [Emydomyces testavorans]
MRKPVTYGRVLYVVFTTELGVSNGYNQRALSNGWVNHLITECPARFIHAKKKKAMGAKAGKEVDEQPEAGDDPVDVTNETIVIDEDPVVGTEEVAQA